MIGTSPFLRKRHDAALILCSGPIAVFVAFWVGGAYVAPRFVSFLLVQLFMLTASGGAAILRGMPKRRAPVRTVVLLLALVALAGHFVVLAPDVLRLPREANREAAGFVADRAPHNSRVYALLKDPQGFDFYLERPFEVLTSERSPRSARANRPVAYVMQPWAVDRRRRPVSEPTRHSAFPIRAIRSRR